MRHNLNPYSPSRYGRWEHSPRVEAFVSYLVNAGVNQFVAYAIAYVGVTAVTSWALRALAPMPEFGASQTGLLTNTRGATNSQELVYGQVRKGGTITFIESNGTDNEYLHQIICLAGHEVNSIGDIYINDVVVTLDADGNVTSSDWQDSNGNSTILIKKFTGAANQNVYTTLSALTDGPSWQGKQTGDDTNFRGQGIACLYVRLKFDQDVFSQGVPLFTAKVQGKKVYDPRNSSTAYSANAALCVRDYLVSKYGLNNSGAVNDTSFSAAANTCDESVTLSGSGTESRYEINGVLNLDRSPSDILADMMTACAGTLFWGAGNWQLKVGEYTTAVKTFTLDDFRSAITLDTKHSRRDNFNIVRGTFVDAASNYVRADYPEIKGSTFISNDSGIESAIDLNLPLTTSSSMAQRLAKMTLFRAREQMTLTADFGMEAFEVQVGDIVGITNDRYTWSAKEFEVVGWKFGNNGDGGEIVISLTLRETSSSAFSWSAEESDIDGNDSSLPNPSANLTISSLSTSGGGRTTLDGTFINSVIVSWNAPSNPFISYYEVEHKPTSDSNYASTTTRQTSIELSPLIDDVAYTIRVRAVTVSGFRGPYVSVSFTAGGDTTAPAKATDITATGHFMYISLDWSIPADNDFNYIEIHASQTNNSSTATQVGISTGSSFTHTNLGLSETWYYWLKTVDYTGNKSDFTANSNWTDNANSAQTTFLDDGDFENNVRQLFIDQGLDVIEPVSSLPASGAYTGQQVFLTSDGKLYNWNGSSWVATVADVGNVDFADLTGQIAASQIVGQVVAANNIVANSITTGQLAASGVITSAGQIDDAVIENAKIANLAVERAKIGNIAAMEVLSFEHSNFSITTSSTTEDDYQWEKLLTGAVLDFDGNASTVVDVIVNVSFIPVGTFSSTARTEFDCEIEVSYGGQWVQVASQEFTLSNAAPIPCMSYSLSWQASNTYDNTLFKVMGNFNKSGYSNNASGQQGVTITGTCLVRYR